MSYNAFHVRLKSLCFYATYRAFINCFNSSSSSSSSSSSNVIIGTMAVKVVFPVVIKNQVSCFPRRSVDDVIIFV